MPAQAWTGTQNGNAEATAQPLLHYDAGLPITAHRAAILEAMAAHQVLVVAGETGSGKTTQLPKICLEAGRGTKGLIGCTQPRRIAARAVAERVAEELQTPVGGLVGYQVRFTDRTAQATRVKFMTDGILLAETQGDKALRAYDTLILDEAHERSLNIDFLLGYLRRLLSRRPELKLIITSATIDTARFAEHFDGAPVIEVSGRTYPVEVRYRPLDEPQELNHGIGAALEELKREKQQGDTLVFLSGEREIREASLFLRKQKFANTEILPLYGRLSANIQHKVFHPGKQRRVVLATNVAETSLTVPRIAFVIDAGTARISRYSPRSKIQRLPIEPVSQASAAQRAGRCGRLGPGVCIRLYSEEDFEARAEFTEPEILRTNLASVILRMKALRLGAVEDFPFLDRPAPQQISDGYQLLTELSALDSQRALTPLGRDLARLPVDPRIGRIVLAGAEQGCLADVLILAAALSIQDPRERPLDAQEKADEAHAQFADADSDFNGLLKLWHIYEAKRERLSGNALDRWCRKHFLSHRRMREWREVHHQLKILARGLQLSTKGKGGYEALHRALLAGLISHVGRRDEDKTFEAPRQRRFVLHPSSALAAKPPKWVVGAELVETSRVFARINARIQPQWVEDAAAHLVKRHWFDPWYERRGARVKAFEQVSLFGLHLVEQRRVHYGPVNPAEARRVFIRHALVRFEYDTEAPFMQHNRALTAEVKDLEHKQRRHDVLAHESALMQFFESRIAPEIYTGKAFERWRREAERGQPRLLFLDRDDLMRHQAVDVSAARYPETVEVRGNTFALEYHFEPGHVRDGVTIMVPLHQLRALDARRLEWLVPGLIREKLTALIKGLPKAKRRNLMPVPDFVQALLEAMPYGEGDLYESAAGELTRISGAVVAARELRAVPLPDHLSFNIQVADEAGEVLGESRDLERLQGDLREEAGRVFAEKSGDAWHRDGLAAWDFGQLPGRVALKGGMIAYPALVDQGARAGLRAFQSVQEARAAHREGLVRLLMTSLPDKMKYLRRKSPITAETCMRYATLDTCEALKADLEYALVAGLIGEDSHRVRDAGAFNALVERIRAALLAEAVLLGDLINDILKAYFGVARQLENTAPRRRPEAAEDMAEQLAWLVWPGFVRECPRDRLQHYPRYLNALGLRLAAMPRDPSADAEKQRCIAPYWQAYLECVEQHGWPGTPAMERLRWLIEEYRVSLFAQKLGTAEPVSRKRLDRAVESQTAM